MKWTVDAACISRSGRPTRRECRSSGITTDGIRDPIPCGCDPEAGVWETFIPDLGAGAQYKYYIDSRHNGYQVEKADPYGFAAEIRPQTASKVWD